MMNRNNYGIIQKNHKVFLLILAITFSILIFTSSAHRFTSDDYLAYSQAERIVNQTPIENFVLGVGINFKINIGGMASKTCIKKVVGFLIY